MENDALKVVEIVEQAKANLAELVEKLQQSSKEYNDMKESISSKKIGEVDLNAEVERLTGEVKAHVSRKLVLLYFLIFIFLISNFFQFFRLMLKDIIKKILIIFVNSMKKNKGNFSLLLKVLLTLLIILLKLMMKIK